MRVVLAAAMLFFCQTPLWAEGTDGIDPFANLPMTFSAEHGSNGTFWRLNNQLFNMEIWHEGFTKQVAMDWALLSPGAKCLDDNWWLGILVEYTEPPSEASRLLKGWQDEDRPPNMYLSGHHISDTMELYLFYPLARHIEGKTLHPWFEIKWLRLFDINQNAQVYFTGKAGSCRPSEYAFGVRYQYKAFTLKAQTDGVMSLGAGFATRF